VCDLETSRMGAPYIYDISHLRVKSLSTPRSHSLTPSLIHTHISTSLSIARPTPVLPHTST